MGKRKNEEELVKFVWKRNSMYDIALLSEVESRNPYAFRIQKHVWQEIANTLQDGELKMKVTERACRDRVNELLKTHRKNEHQSAVSSGIDEAEMTETQKLITSVGKLQAIKYNKETSKLYSRKHASEVDAIRAAALLAAQDSEDSNDDILQKDIPNQDEGNSSSVHTSNQDEGNSSSVHTSNQDEGNSSSVHTSNQDEGNSSSVHTSNQDEGNSSSVHTSKHSQGTPPASVHTSKHSQGTPPASVHTSKHSQGTPPASVYTSKHSQANPTASVNTSKHSQGTPPASAHTSSNSGLNLFFADDGDDEFETNKTTDRPTPKRELVRYLETKSEKEIAVRKEELKLKRKEIDVKAQEVANKTTELDILRTKTQAEADDRTRMHDLLLTLINRK